MDHHSRRYRMVVAAIVLLICSSPQRAWAATWESKDIGPVGVPGNAIKDGDVWTIHGAGADIWDSEDAFQFLHALAWETDGYVIARVINISDGHPFSKAGVMVRGTLDPNAATVVLDVKPNHEIEFMHRSTAGAQMVYDGGMFVTAPVWLRLSWGFSSSSGGITHAVTAAASEDGTTWTTIGNPVTFTFPCCSTMEAGAVVTSHDPSTTSTAQFDSLSMLPSIYTSTDVGATGLRGSAAISRQSLTVDGAGGDIWGTADSFQFVHFTWSGDGTFDSNLLSIDNTHPFAKAGLMFRDGVGADATFVILDVKPNSEVEFMARLCTGCETQYLGGTRVTLPAELYIVRTGSTFDAYVSPPSSSGPRRLVGSITIPMPPRVEAGFAVTSHDPAQLNTAVFGSTER
jgi:hypothetical protein